MVQKKTAIHKAQSNEDPSATWLVFNSSNCIFLNISQLPSQSSIFGKMAIQNMFNFVCDYEAYTIYP